MFLKMLCLGLGMAVCLAGSTSAAKGGSGPVSITSWKGVVLIKPLRKYCRYRANVQSPVVAIPNRWQPVRKGDYVGEFLLLTKRGSWVQLNNRMACVDSNSLILLGSGADIAATVQQGGISAVDGRKGPVLYKPGQTMSR